MFLFRIKVTLHYPPGGGVTSDYSRKQDLTTTRVLDWISDNTLTIDGPVVEKDPKIRSRYT